MPNRDRLCTLSWGAGEPRPFAVSYSHVSHPYPREYATFEPDLDGLARLAQAGGGLVDPASTWAFDPAGESIERQTPRQNPFILTALVVFLLDLLMRRVRLFDRGFKRKAA